MSNQRLRRMTLNCSWPASFDAAAAERLLERFPGPDSEGLTDMLQGLGGNSPYLSDLAVREAETLQQILKNGPDSVLRSTLRALSNVPLTAPHKDIAAALRQAKREAALTIAVADVGGIWKLENVTGALSQLAEAALSLALRHLLRGAHDRAAIRLAHPDEPDTGCGFVVLGMGKLGGRELNYSSDIDLILLYDNESPVLTSGSAADSLSAFTARLTRDLVALMETRGPDGYVFRTDLRLRPDPAATPPAISLTAALTYYESMGQNWERAAMIKARPVAGDAELGERFLEAIRPFVWRRGLDFAAVADIKALKRRINVIKNAGLRQEADPVARLAGYNVKLGEGGIREIEFLVQTLQMVWGGRDPSLRLRPTLEAGARLVQTGHLAANSFAQLADAYRFLRQVEHRIQMVSDLQTHSLPESADGIAHIACFMGFVNAQAFAEALLAHIEAVRANYRAVFEAVPSDPEPQVPPLDLSNEDSPALIERLHALGFADHRRVIQGLRTWMAGHVRALRSERARELLTTMLPQILSALGQQTHPDEAFIRFDRFVAGLPAGVQLMALFHHNVALLERVASILGAAPILSEYLASYPNALEGLLPGVAAGYRGVSRLLLRKERLEDAIQTVRRTVKERDFQISVATLDGAVDADAAGRERSALAQMALSALLPAVISDFSARYGHVPGGALAIVALGKAGGREMMAGSDLDLMFIYDHPPEVTESTGAKVLSTTQWFIRAVQACITAVTAPGREGQMYALDMRLRPSGNKGPLAVSLSAFRRYHQADAWTWERMALTRARVVAGPAPLRHLVKQAIRDALLRRRDAESIRADAAAMRRRMENEQRLAGPWDVKLRPGGLIDVEFIAQVLQLIHAGAPGLVPVQTTRLAVRRLADAGFLAEPDAALLIKAEHFWRTVQGMLRLTIGQRSEEKLPEASAKPLLYAAEQAGVPAVDTVDLLRKADALAERVRGLFNQLVGGDSSGAGGG